MTDEITPEDVEHAVRHARLASNPDWDVKHVRFDDAVWHPLDHRIGSARCRSFRTATGPGPAVPGIPSDNRHPIRYHWRSWRVFKADSDLSWFYRRTTCLVGRHKWQTWTRITDGTSFTVCARCPARRNDSP